MQNLSAIGFTAAPEYPDIDDLPSTTGIAVLFSNEMFVIDLIVLIADTAAAPPLSAAAACSSMFLQFGVIFAMNGIFVVSDTALE